MRKLLMKKKRIKEGYVTEAQYTDYRVARKPKELKKHTHTSAMCN